MGRRIGATHGTHVAVRTLSPMTVAARRLRNHGAKCSAGCAVLRPEDDRHWSRPRGGASGTRAPRPLRKGRKSAQPLHVRHRRYGRFRTVVRPCGASHRTRGCQVAIRPRPRRTRTGICQACQSPRRGPRTPAGARRVEEGNSHHGSDAQAAAALGGRPDRGHDGRGAFGHHPARTRRPRGADIRRGRSGFRQRQLHSDAQGGNEGSVAGGQGPRHRSTGRESATPTARRSTAMR